MKLKLLNGNDQFYKTKTDLRVVLRSKINDIALKNWEKETGLKFTKNSWYGLISKPISSHRIVKLLTQASTFKFEVSYSDNVSEPSTLFLDIAPRTL